MGATYSKLFSLSHLPSSLPVVDPTPDDPLVSVILVSLLPLLVMGIMVAGMFYWYRAYRQRMLNQEWESSIKKRKPRAGGLDCSDACAIMMDDDRSDSSSTHANNLNHNTEPLPIDLDLLVYKHSSILDLFSGPILRFAILTKMITPDLSSRWAKVALLRYTRLSWSRPPQISSKLWLWRFSPMKSTLPGRMRRTFSPIQTSDMRTSSTSWQLRRGRWRNSTGSSLPSTPEETYRWDHHCQC